MPKEPNIITWDQLVELYEICLKNKCDIPKALVRHPDVEKEYKKDLSQTNPKLYRKQTLEYWDHKKDPFKLDFNNYPYYLDKHLLHMVIWLHPNQTKYKYGPVIDPEIERQASYLFINDDYVVFRNSPKHRSVKIIPHYHIIFNSRSYLLERSKQRIVNKIMQVPITHIGEKIKEYYESKKTEEILTSENELQEESIWDEVVHHHEEHSYEYDKASTDDDSNLEESLTEESSEELELPAKSMPITIEVKRTRYIHHKHKHHHHRFHIDVMTHHHINHSPTQTNTNLPVCVLDHVLSWGTSWHQLRADIVH